MYMSSQLQNYVHVCMSIQISGNFDVEFSLDLNTSSIDRTIILYVQTYMYIHKIAPT